MAQAWDRPGLRRTRDRRLWTQMGTDPAVGLPLLRRSPGRLPLVNEAQRLMGRATPTATSCTGGVDRGGKAPYSAAQCDRFEPRAEPSLRMIRSLPAPTLPRPATRTRRRVASGGRSTSRRITGASQRTRTRSCRGAARRISERGRCSAGTGAPLTLPIARRRTVRRVAPVTPSTKPA